MARPRLYEEERVATAVRMPLSLRERLQEAATERDVSVNLLVVRAVSEFLGRLAPLDDELASSAHGKAPPRGAAPGRARGERARRPTRSRRGSGP